MENFTTSAENSAILQNQSHPSQTFHIPKFFQAILSLIISALLIALTLGIIKRIKKLCTTQCPKIGIPSNAPSTIIVVPLTQENVEVHTQVSQESNGMIPTTPLQSQQSLSVTPTPSPCPSGTSTASRGRRKSSNKVYPANLNVPNQSLPRRCSGPFGEESLQFVQETYRKPKSTQRNPDLEGKSRHYHKSMRHYN